MPELLFKFLQLIQEASCFSISIQMCSVDNGRLGQRFPNSNTDRFLSPALPELLLLLL
jgi:hypothetical protein